MINDSGGVIARNNRDQAEEMVEKSLRFQRSVLRSPVEHGSIDGDCRRALRVTSSASIEVLR
jgi:hypothetical protein